MVAICQADSSDNNPTIQSYLDENNAANVAAASPSSFCYDDAVLNLKNKTTSTKKKTKLPFFYNSLFSNVPPTVRFALHEEAKVEKPKKTIRKLLKFKHNSLTPRVIRRALVNSHFEITSIVDSSGYWLGYWGRHLKTVDFRQILPYQKVNHFPGAFNMGRKDKLWTNIDRFSYKYRKSGQFSDLMPKTYILPHDSSLLKEKMQQDGQLTPFILKPPASARGTGVRVVHRWSQVPRRGPLIAQHYIENPLLIHGSKFDLRLYVYVTSFDPLKIYLYDEGLVRFASVKYSKCLSTMANRLMHLTNYSLNKAAIHDENIENKSETGVKWDLSKFWTHLEQNGCDSRKLQYDIIDLIIKTLICCETPINDHIKQHIVNNSYWSCHELYGFDVVVDDQLKPWLVEVNISPSLQSSTELDKKVKSRLAVDVLNLAGIQVPDCKFVQSCSTRLAADFTQPTSPCKADYRTKPWCKVPQENSVKFNSTSESKEKRQSFVDSFEESRKIDPAILENLNNEDLRFLIDLEDEFQRKGRFSRIFPQQETTTRYLHFFETTRYANLLIDEWLSQYFHIRETGVKLLESFCQRNAHLAQ